MILDPCPKCGSRESGCYPYDCGAWWCVGTYDYEQRRWVPREDQRSPTT